MARARGDDVLLVIAGILLSSVGGVILAKLTGWPLLVVGGVMVFLGVYLVVAVWLDLPRPGRRRDDSPPTSSAPPPPESRRPSIEIGGPGVKVGRVFITDSYSNNPEGLAGIFGAEIHDAQLERNIHDVLPRQTADQESDDEDQDGPDD